ncbi:MAG: hypothetical protein Ct9H300mP3_07240 [Gammaproteobacteria bacterium]|nr:MAG: hypothetical protein Ct9H300mP3_07240 [Gammaproteobacteria bacterium]
MIKYKDPIAEFENLKNSKGTLLGGLILSMLQE